MIWGGSEGAQNELKAATAVVRAQHFFTQGFQMKTRKQMHKRHKGKGSERGEAVGLPPTHLES